MSATTKAKRQASVATKAKAQPKAKAKPKAKPVEDRVSKTDVRRETHAAIEAAAESKKPLTLAQVQERFGEYGYRGSQRCSFVAITKSTVRPATKKGHRCE